MNAYIVTCTPPWVRSLTCKKGVPPPQHRITAALKMKKAGYPVSFLIAPVFIFPGWKNEYRTLLEKLAETWQNGKKESAGPTFEIIAHRFTSRAKKRIQEIFPDSTQNLGYNSAEIVKPDPP